MDYDVIVIGGGHAGIEASLVCARLSLKALIVTQNIDTIGKLSCNPAVGGLSKGNIVREIDALGGEMAHLIDQSTLQFRMLNQSKGAAVQSPRAQADRHLYSLLARETLESQPGLELLQDTVKGLLVSSDGLTVQGVITDRERSVTAKSVIIATGTFLDSKVYIGDYTRPWGRFAEETASDLAYSLRELNYPLGRLKTGTSPRVSASSIDFSTLAPQLGDSSASRFSYFKSYETCLPPALPCYLTKTNELTRDIILESLPLSPLYGRKIVGPGPRYCPSIEDKILRFPDKTSHQIFLEPEHAKATEYYINGLSTSFPEAIQEEIVHSVKGLEKAHITRPGYAVEYAFINPLGLFPSLMSRRHEGLFFAGQINGTSGYEEAGCQGFMAGLNAQRYIAGEAPLVLGREEAYIGVLIDDLVTKGTQEPYRMFTSRAEHRLLLRQDDADRRLFPLAIDLGLHTELEAQMFADKYRQIDAIKELLSSQRRGGEALRHYVKRPEVYLDDPVFSKGEFLQFDLHYLRQALSEVKYEGYVERQRHLVEKMKKKESKKIPEAFDFRSVKGLSTEAYEKLEAVRPLTLGQAMRISGLRDSDLALLFLFLQKKEEHD